MTDQRQRVAAEFCSYVDQATSHLNLEISLPGVDKKDIELKINDDSFHLVAPRDNYDYVSASAFCCPVQASTAQARFDNGLLKVKVAFKDPMEDAYRVTIV